MLDISHSNKELNIHDTLMPLINSIEEKEVGVFLSSGVDSQCLFFALKEAGKNVTAYTFTLEDRESRDFKMARSIAEQFDANFVPIILPTNIETLIQDVFILHDKYNCRKKTEYECMWPFLYAYPLVKTPIVLTGIGSDGHFCLTKRGMMHYKDRVDEYRDEYWAKSHNVEYYQHRVLADMYNTKVYEPYREQSLIDYFRGTTWNECNKPKQKQPILNAFPEEFASIKVYPHTNFQLGDSGIAELFTKLLNTKLNTGNYKSVVGVYNAIHRMRCNNGKRKLI